MEVPCDMSRKSRNNLLWKGTGFSNFQWASTSGISRDVTTTNTTTTTTTIITVRKKSIDNHSDEVNTTKESIDKHSDDVNTTMDFLESDIVQITLSDSDKTLPELDIKTEESEDETPNVTVFRPLISSKKSRGKFERISNKCTYDVATDSDE